MVDLYQAVSISVVKALHVFYALLCVSNMGLEACMHHRCQGLVITFCRFML